MTVSGRSDFDTPSGTADIARVETLQRRYQEVRQRIARAARASGRRESDVILVAVTKFADPEQIRVLLHLGHRDFGENRVQALVQRAAMVEEYARRHRTLPTVRGPLPADPVRWHMIGHLQRNKVRKVIEVCRLIHSVDSLRLAEEIHVHAARRPEPMDVLLQVNCSGEATKFGCPMPAAIHLAEQIDTMVNVRLRGLMTMAPLCADPRDARPTFARLRELFEEIRQAGIGGEHFNLLSMGMSNDFEVAIAEGANVVRVGTAIFGEPIAPAPDGETQPDDPD